MHKNVFTLPVNFIGSYTEDEPGFPRQNNLRLQKTDVWRRQLEVVNLKNFSRPNKKNQVPFKDLNRIQGLCKTTIKIQDLFKIVRAMLPKNPLPRQPSTGGSTTFISHEAHASCQCAELF